MQFTLKEYRVLKIKKFIKNSIVFINFFNANSNNWILIEKNLKKRKYDYYRVFNKVSLKILKNSTFKNYNLVSHGFTTFVKPNLNQFKYLYSSFNNITLLKMFFVKTNNRIYSINQLKKIVFLKYLKNIMFYYMFKIIILNLFKVISK
jgi:hypothetical protein